MKAAQVAGSRRARVAQREAQRRRSQRFFVGGIILLVGLFALVVLMTRSETASESPIAQTRAVEIEGDALPPLAEDDSAVGMQIPSVSGRSFSGEQIEIGPGGGPKVLMFLAHWCPHCQAEVTTISSWITSEGLPEGVELISIATATDPAQPNYPPSEWLEREGWTVPVLVDDQRSSAGVRFGVNSYPFFVFVDADGNVHSRASGEIAIPELERVIEELRD